MRRSWFVAQPDVVPPILPAAPHPVQVPSTSPSAPRCPKGRAAIRGLLLGRRRGYFASTTTCRESRPSIRAASFPSTSHLLCLYRCRAFWRRAAFVSKTLFRSPIDRASAAHISNTRLGTSPLFYSTESWRGLRRNVSFRRLLLSALSSPSSTARSWALVFPCPVLPRSVFAARPRYRLSSCRRHRCLAHSFPNCKCL